MKSNFFSKPVYSLLIIFCFFIGILSVKAKPIYKDSLLIVRAFQLPDSKSKVDSLLKFVLEHRKETDVEPLIREAIRLMHVYNYTEIEPKLLDTYGVIKRDHSEYAASIDFHKQALSLAQKRNDIKAQVNSLNNLGVVYRRLDESSLALKYHLDALKLAIQIKDDYSESIALNSIGNIHIVLGNYRTAISYFQQCLPIAKRANNDLGIAMNLNNIGEAYENLNLLDSAKFYYELSLEYNQHVNIIKGTNINYNAIGNVLVKQGKPTEAIVLFKKALESNLKLGDQIYVANNYNNLGRAYLASKQYENAENSLKEALKIAQSIHSKGEIRDAYQTLMDLNEAQLRFEKALQYSKANKAYADSILNEKNSRTVAQMEAIYNKEKEQQQIVILEKSQKISRLIVLSLFGLLILVLISGFLLLHRHNLAERNTQLQRQLDFRNQVAANLHDDIGSMLTNISLLAELSRKKINQPEMALDFINRLSEEINLSEQALHDIIWSVNSKNDTLEEMFDHMRRYASELFDAGNTQYHLQLDETGTRKLGMEQRHNLFLIYKESLKNIYKHAEASNVWITVTLQNKMLFIEIKDDGKGFNTAQKTHRNGLSNLSQRVETMNGIFNLTSSPGHGTEIRISIPIQS